MKKVMCFGTFDGFHLGHEFYLKESKKHGDYLVVVVARDETVLQVKGRMPKRKLAERISEIEKAKIADKVIPGNPGDKLKVVVEEKPNVICLGYDQTSFTDGLKTKLEAIDVKAEIVRIGSLDPHLNKSSLIDK